MATSVFTRVYPVDSCSVLEPADPVPLLEPMDAVSFLTSPDPASLLEPAGPAPRLEPVDPTSIPESVGPVPIKEPLKRNPRLKHLRSFSHDGVLRKLTGSDALFSNERYVTGRSIRGNDLVSVDLDLYKSVGNQLNLFTNLVRFMETKGCTSGSLCQIEIIHRDGVPRLCAYFSATEGRFVYTDPGFIGQSMNNWCCIQIKFSLLQKAVVAAEKLQLPDLGLESVIKGTLQFFKLVEGTTINDGLFQDPIVVDIPKVL